MRAGDSFAHEPDVASAGTGPTGLIDEERFTPEPYCDYCEQDGHTFRSCPRRDDDPEPF